MGNPYLEGDAAKLIHMKKNVCICVYTYIYIYLSLFALLWGKGGGQDISLPLALLLPGIRGE